MWVAFTLFAALNQAIRTALQKHAAASLPAFFVAWMRFAFGLPFALLWLFFVLVWQPQTIELSVSFWLYSVAAACAQLVATWFAVRMLTLRNFAVGTMWIKSEAIFTTIFAFIFFGLAMSWPLLMATIIGAGGLMVLAAPKKWFNQSTWYGIGAGIGFALCSLWIGEAAESTGLHSLLAGAVTLVAVLVVQVLVATPLLSKANWQQLPSNWKPAWLIGLTSAMGSIGWFTAMAMVSPAWVKTLGQSEFIFTLLITYLVFGERLNRREWIGVAIVLMAIILLVVARW